MALRLSMVEFRTKNEQKLTRKKLTVVLPPPLEKSDEQVLTKIPGYRDICVSSLKSPVF